MRVDVFPEPRNPARRIIGIGFLMIDLEEVPSASEDAAAEDRKLVVVCERMEARLMLL